MDKNCPTRGPLECDSHLFFAHCFNLLALTDNMADIVEKTLCVLWKSQLKKCLTIINRSHIGIDGPVYLEGCLGRNILNFLSKPHLEICLKLFNYPGAAVAPEADMFNNDIVDGPVAVLFAHNVEEAVTARGSNPEKANRDLQRIDATFFKPEKIP